MYLTHKCDKELGHVYSLNSSSSEQCNVREIYYICKPSNATIYSCKLCNYNFKAL